MLCISLLLRLPTRLLKAHGCPIENGEDDHSLSSTNHTEQRICHHTYGRAQRCQLQRRAIAYKYNTLQYTYEMPRQCIARGVLHINTALSRTVSRAAASPGAAPDLRVGVGDARDEAHAARILMYRLECLNYWRIGFGFQPRLPSTLRMSSERPETGEQRTPCVFSSFISHHLPTVRPSASFAHVVSAPPSVSRLCLFLALHVPHPLGGPEYSTVIAPHVNLTARLQYPEYYSAHVVSSPLCRPRLRR